MQAAFLLGFHLHDISVLIRTGLLQPLGNPARNAPRYFWSGLIEELSGDSQWLAQATDALAAHWQRKNATLSSSAPRGASTPRKRRSRYGS